jgi:DNA-binding SARP family transcriptional activator
VLTTRQWVYLNADIDWVIDLEAFNDLGRTAGDNRDELEQAVRCYAGELLPAYGYGDWVIPIRERA